MMREDNLQNLQFRAVWLIINENLRVKNDKF
jgi:hypothetical protein